MNLFASPFSFLLLHKEKLNSLDFSYLKLCKYVIIDPAISSVKVLGVKYLILLKQEMTSLRHIDSLAGET